MATGVVKWYNADKRYGFLVPDKGGADVFIHASQLEDSGLKEVKEGDRLEYDLGQNKGRSCATNIKKVK